MAVSTACYSINTAGSWGVIGVDICILNSVVAIAIG